MHSQRKKKSKILKKFLKNQKSINVAPFNKDVAPGKNLKNKRTCMFIPDSRVVWVCCEPCIPIKWEADF